MGIQENIRLSSISSQGQMEMELPKAMDNIFFVFPDSNLNKGSSRDAPDMGIESY